jgi:rhodanese-related sulfurtransferase
MNSKKAFAAAVTVMLVAALYVAAAARRAHAIAGPDIAPAQEQSGAAKHEITAADLKKRLDKHQATIILDSRGSVSGQTIKDAQHVPTSEVDEWAKSVAKTSFIVTFCTCPHDEAAEASVAKLRNLGFENAFSLKGGLNAAIQAGIPTVDVTE